MNIKETGYAMQEFPAYLDSRHQELPQWITKLRQLCTICVEALCNADQPKIYMMRDQAGRVYWTVHSPAGRRLHFDSEAEVRGWLDRRYYQ